MENVVYFFDQPNPRRRLGRRKRKLAEDSFGLNTSASLYYQTGRRDSIQSSDVSSDRSLLPEIKQTVSRLKQQLDGIFGENEDVQRLIYEEAKLSAPDLLTYLEMYLNKFTHMKPSVPASLEHDLMSDWNELIADVQYAVREWQCLRNQEPETLEDKVTRKELSTTSAGTETSSKTFTKPPSIMDDLETQSTLGKDLRCIRNGRKSISSVRSNLVGIVENGEKKMERASHPKVLTKSHVQLSVCSSRSESIEPGQRDVSNTVSKSHGVTDVVSKAVASNQVGYWTQIQFQLSSKVCRDKGWITDSSQMESEITIEKVLRQVTERLRTAIKDSKEQSEQGKEQDFSVTLFQFYGDNLRETISKSKWSGSVTAQGLQVLKGLKPRIPPLTVAMPGKALFKTSMLDGSSIVYYPSGKVALTYTRPGQPLNLGFYTVAYDDEPSHRMLACFTPSGKGCCYYDDGSLWFLATEDGFFMAEQGSLVMERQEWPALGSKLSNPLFLQLNQRLSFRCHCRQSMQLSFICQRQTVKFYFGLTPGTEKSPTKEELGCLLSGLDFSSKTARNFTGSQYQRLIKQKNKLKITALIRTSSTSDSVTETLATSPTSENISININKDSESSCLKLEKRIRTLLEDWLVYYRSALGILPPEAIVTEAQSECDDIQSASFSPADSETVMQDESSDFSHSLPAVRLLSAPAGEGGWSRKQQHPIDQPSRSVKFRKNHMEKVETPGGLGSIKFTTSSTTYGSLLFCPMTTVKPRNFVIQPVNLETLGPTLGLCPAKLRLAMMGELESDKHCFHHTIPFITDVEYDEFIGKFVPANQLAIVAVISTANPEATMNCRKMLEHIHEQQSRTRLWPCFQSRYDAYRIFLYDIATAAECFGNTEPLLFKRHNIDSGMFLMYKCGQLRFCDHIFNGYSTEEKDFMKQLEITNLSADRGHFLPSNFRFSPQLKRGTFLPSFGYRMDNGIDGKKPSSVRMLSEKNGIDQISRPVQNQVVLDQVCRIIRFSDSATDAITKKTRSERNDSITSSTIASLST